HRCGTSARRPCWPLSACFSQRTEGGPQAAAPGPSMLTGQTGQCRIDGLCRLEWCCFVGRANHERAEEMQRPTQDKRDTVGDVAGKRQRTSRADYNAWLVDAGKPSRCPKMRGFLAAGIQQPQLVVTIVEFLQVQLDPKRQRGKRHRQRLSEPDRA